MRKLLLASMIAVASMVAIAPAGAASVTIGVGDDSSYNDNYYRHHRRSHDDRYDRRDREYRHDRGHHWGQRRHCRTEWVTRWRHHHRVVEKVRVCS